MQIGQFLFNNLEYVCIAISPLVIFGVIKLKSYKGSRNDLTPLLIKLSKKKDVMTKRSKSSLF